MLVIHKLHPPQLHQARLVLEIDLVVGKSWGSFGFILGVNARKFWTPLPTLMQTPPAYTHLCGHHVPGAAPSPPVLPAFSGPNPSLRPSAQGRAVRGGCGTSGRAVVLPGLHRAPVSDHVTRSSWFLPLKLSEHIYAIIARQCQDPR